MWKFLIQNPKPNTNFSSWRFQPIWKILVKMGIFPKLGVTIKNIWNHHLANFWPCHPSAVQNQFDHRWSDSRSSQPSYCILSLRRSRVSWTTLRQATWKILKTWKGVFNRKNHLLGLKNYLLGLKNDLLGLNTWIFFCGMISYTTQTCLSAYCKVVWLLSEARG